jgi:ribosomal protein S14
VLEYRPLSQADLAAIERPRCPKCQQPRMLLSKIEAGPSDLEYRVFECQKCGRTHTMIISSYPMESNVCDGLDGELSAPVSGVVQP